MPIAITSLSEHYAKHSEKYGKTIVFAVDTLHAQTLVQEFREQKIDADYVDYTRPDAAKVMADFRDKHTPRVLVNVEMLTEGYDAPRTKTVFLARPTKSEALLSQMVGRAFAVSVPAARRRPFSSRLSTPGRSSTPSRRNTSSTKARLTRR